MAPHTVGMAAEEPLGPWALSPVGELKLMPELRLEDELNGNQDATHRHTDEPAAVTR